MPRDVVYCIMFSDYERQTLKEIYRYKHDAEEAVEKHNATLSEVQRGSYRYYYITERNLY